MMEKNPDEVLKRIRSAHCCPGSSRCRPEPAPAFYNEKGQTTGTATTSGNTTTFRNEKGQTTGTATTNSSGTTTFRNNLGQTTGTATRGKVI